MGLSDTSVAPPPIRSRSRSSGGGSSDSSSEYRSSPSRVTRWSRARWRSSESGVSATDDELPASDVECLEVGDTPVRHERAARQNGHAIAERFGVRQHVRAEEDGASTIAQRQDQIAHVPPSERIEAGHRLVEKRPLPDR